MDSGCTVDVASPPPLAPGDALFLDFDGTIVDLAVAPDRVRVGPSVPRLLAALAQRQGGAVAVVSGRRIVELQQLLAPWDGVFAGQHGAEIRRADGSVSRRAPPLPPLSLLEEFTARHPGTLLEEKGVTIALHYRQAPGLAGECAAIAEAAARAGGGVWRVVTGKMVVELVPCGIGKGKAIGALLAEAPFRGRRPVFVGDDMTDEDGFVAVAAAGGVAVRVGPGTSAAHFRLSGVAAVLAWLARDGGR